MDDEMQVKLRYTMSTAAAWAVLRELANRSYSPSLPSPRSHSVIRSTEPGEIGRSYDKSELCPTVLRGDPMNDLFRQRVIHLAKL